VARNLVSVVDDDESIRRTTTLLIESFGFRAAALNLPRVSVQSYREIQSGKESNLGS
jgi:FixJ family two-component response regulator